MTLMTDQEHADLVAQRDTAERHGDTLTVAMAARALYGMVPYAVLARLRAADFADVSVTGDRAARRWCARRRAAAELEVEIEVGAA
jgi:hypothetical protein